MLADLSTPEKIGDMIDSALEVATEERDLFKIEQLSERPAQSFRGEMTSVFSGRIKEQMASGALRRVDAPVIATFLINLTERTIYECLVWETGDLERYRETLKWTFVCLLL